MFLVRGDGTPYDIIYNLVNGNQIIYPIIVVVLFFGYITLFYYIYFLILFVLQLMTNIDELVDYT